MCCKDCARREIGCHASCGEYAKYREIMNLAREQRANNESIDFILRRKMRRIQAIKRNISGGD